MKMFEYSAHTLIDLFKKGELSAENIVKDYLQRIELYNPDLYAFLHITSEKARQKAFELDQKRKKGLPLGKLAGVPIAIKDNIHVKGEITTCGSKFLENYIAQFDATAVRYLEEEGAIIIGKTNLDEFGMGSSGKHSAFSPTRNPWDLDCSPGGSSSGSAAAVSARLCPMALGTDTGGSVRQPASLTGTVGFKPTYGRISRYGVVAYGSSLDQIGPITTTTRDTALIMEVIARYCDRDSTKINVPPVFMANLEKPINNTRIGVAWKFIESLSGDVYQNFQESIKKFQKLGAEIVEIDLEILKYSIAAYYILSTSEAATNLARFDGIRYGHRSKQAKTIEEVYTFSRREGFGKEVKNRILLGTYVLSSGYSQAYYEKAQKVRTLIIRKIREAFSQCNMIALPTSPTPAFRLDAIQDPLEEYLQDIYTVSANLAGIPAISIPSGFSQSGKPLGLQLLGPQMGDADVLRFAHAFEVASDFSAFIPPNYKGHK